MNLTIEDDIAIGDSSIVRLSEQLVASLETTHSIKFNLNLKDHPEKPIEYLTNINETKTYTVVNVEAPDSKKALELAIQKVETCLNILRLFTNQLEPPFVLRDEFKKTIGQRIIQLNVNRKLYSELGSNVNLITNHFPTIFGKDCIEKFKANNLPIINSLLKKADDELTPLQEDLLTAIMWFGNAAKEIDRKMKFVKYMMALEALLVPDGVQRKSDTIAKRFASIVFATNPSVDKKEAFKDMRELYRLRNSIIHSGEGYVYEDDLEKLYIWAKITVQMLLERSGKFRDLQEALSEEFPIDETLYN